MVSGLRAGHSLLAAMALVARECAPPVNTEFKICFEEQNYGLEMKDRSGESDHAGSVAGPDDHHHRDPDSEGERRQPGRGFRQDLVCDPGAFPAEAPDYGAHRPGASYGVDSYLLPIVLGIGIYFVDPGMISILWHRDIGIKLMWAAAGLIAVGGFVIWKIVDIDV